MCQLKSYKIQNNDKLTKICLYFVNWFISKLTHSDSRFNKMAISLLWLLVPLQDLAEWLERLTANAVVATLGLILRHSGIWGAADEAMLNIVLNIFLNPPFNKKRKKLLHEAVEDLGSSTFS
jgi:hypothetical protein